MRLNDSQRDTQSKYDSAAAERDRQHLAELLLQVQALSKELVDEKEKVRTEHHRVYKYEKEIQNVVRIDITIERESL